MVWATSDARSDSDKDRTMDLPAMNVNDAVNSTCIDYSIADEYVFNVLCGDISIFIDDVDRSAGREAFVQT